MWPWEHLAVGYVVFSMWCRATGRDRPGTGAVVAVAVGSQFPDLVDKPLGWGTTLLPSGTSLAHSLLVALPVAVVAVALGRWLARPTVGVAFALSYLAHLPGDVVYPLLLGDEPKLAFLLWPVVPAEPTPPTAVFGRAGKLFGEFLAALSTPAGTAFLVVEAVLLGTAVLLWRADGHPGLELFRRRSADRTS
ncbi:metal-dependent hydrolase [Haloarcula sp. S1CR25-12]|uniref:Metal-dependent hydrolase n=1 Tax=Haloarcula saliterrae TaxID=2950534 RepID=A0ABU2F8C2_9EURY|nr:metal-dependent hydrolase [Haloarcula sp. S1CR25-12]MDS0258489.1 metal-dependent hydrolase [Haloarcula sp. S1CR25-12]